MDFDIQVLYYEIRNPIDIESLQDNIFESCQWANKWKLVFNAKKCKSLHMGRNEGNLYYIKNNEGNIEEIKQVDSEKDLGVLFDSELKFSMHISEKVKKANRNLGLICKTFTYMDRSMFLSLYKALVRPHLEYASPVWSPRLKRDQIAVENVQRRASRMVSGLKELPYPERLRNLGIPSLEY